MNHFRTVNLSLITSLCLLTPVAIAVPANIKDFSSFDYTWDFEQGANSLDQYNNTTLAPGGDGVSDWSNTLGPTILVNNGDLQLRNTSLRQETGNGVAPAYFWDQIEISRNTGYTIEYTVNILNTVGDGLAIYEIPADTSSTYGINFLLENSDTEVGIYNNITNGDGDKLTTVPAGGFFTIRVAAEPDASIQLGLKYSVYLNDTLLIGDQPFTRGLSGERLIMGRLGGGGGVDMDIEEIGFTVGPYAPVPEPATAALFALSAALFIRRR